MASRAASHTRDDTDSDDDGNFEPMEVEGGRVPSRTRTSLPLLPVLPLFVPGANPSARRAGLMLALAATCAVILAVLGPLTVLQLFGGVLKGFGGIGPTVDSTPRGIAATQGWNETSMSMQSNETDAERLLSTSTSLRDSHR